MAMAHGWFFLKACNCYSPVLLEQMFQLAYLLLPVWQGFSIYAEQCLVVIRFIKMLSQNRLDPQAGNVPVFDADPGRCGAQKRLGIAEFSALRVMPDIDKQLYIICYQTIDVLFNLDSFVAKCV